MKKLLLIISGILFFINLLFAQNPYHIGWKKDGIILGTSATIAIVGQTMKSSMDPLSETKINSLSSDDVNKFDRRATEYFSEKGDLTSDLILYANLASPLGLSLQHNSKNDLMTLGVMYLETGILGYYLPVIVKASTKRTRPFVYNSKVPMDIKKDSDARCSFFSGHTTLAFASSTFFSTVFCDYFPQSKWKPYIKAGFFISASAVASLRFTSGNHYPTDILTGAVVGSAIGYLIPYTHRIDQQKLFSLIPSITKNNFSLNLVINL